MEVGQYVCFYIGLAHTTGVNSAVVDSLTNFFAIIIASIFMGMEKLTARVNVESGVVDALKLEYGTDRVMVRKLN